MPPADALLETRGLVAVLGGSRGLLRKPIALVRAVDGVSLAVRRGEAFGIVGESGCGKTTLARTLLGTMRETAGEILLEGRRVDGLDPKRARHERRAIQYLHQDAAGSLDPWWSVGAALREALRTAEPGARDEKRIEDALRAVGLDPTARRLYPHQLSGGQARRAALARILIMTPRIVILDEPTAGLDLSIQAAVLNMLIEIKQERGLTSIFISHDLGVVRLVCDRVGVMYKGRIVEQAMTANLFRAPLHPYTRTLLAATPRLTRERQDAPPPPLSDDAQWTNSCAFHPRCPHADDVCRRRAPALEEVAGGRVACHRWREFAPADEAKIRV